MKITDAVFESSVSLDSRKIFLDTRKEVVFIGRSNVGKSSLMNALMHKKDLVKTSSTPGKTRTANMFLVNKKYHYTDLPGYGFAKLGQELREKLDGLISWYLEEKQHTIVQIVLVLDAKIGAQQSDRDMYDYIQSLGLPVTLVLSKIDRLKKNDIIKTKTHCEEMFFGARVIPISAHKDIGVKDLQKILGEVLKS
ncbi:ribosome biogenesis GTP-binding protein YihA/YsxC [Candidatus Gracilibacteria bacterium]|nr:ribosome biogenesis GTP-binding protein YihA/YsxC [Candidatus Gracilibacteria bacterium]